MTTTPSIAARHQSQGSDVTALAGRLALSAIFLLSGFSKLAAPGSVAGFIEAVGLPFPQLGVWIAIAAEILGGLAIVTGFRAREAACALAIYSVATAIFFHAALGDPNQFNHFFKNIAIAGGLLQIMAFGPGRLSLDARR